jgi:hypothetical protein
VHRAARVRGVICLDSRVCNARLQSRLMNRCVLAFLGAGVSSDGYRSVIPDQTSYTRYVNTLKSQMREKVGARSVDSPGEPGHTLPVRHRRPGSSTLYRYFVPAPPGAESFTLSISVKGALGALAASEARGETTSDVSDSDGLSITSEHERATSPCLRPTLKCRQT